VDPGPRRDGPRPAPAAAAKGPVHDGSRYRQLPVIVALGTTGLQVSRVGLGLAALGRPGYINLGHAADLAGETEVEQMRANAHEVLDAAYDAGVRYFDAARSYGLAEEFLGSWVTDRGLTRDDVTVGSKWGYTYTAGWRTDAEVNEVKDLTIDTLRRQEGESRVLLGDVLALYQIHSATVDSGVLDDAAVLHELARLRADGLAIGVTATGPEQSQTIEAAVATGHFDAVQATFNLLDRSAGPALAAAREAGLGVIVKEAVANGRLTDRGDVPELLAVARERGVGADAIALSFVLAQPWADVVLSGAATASTLSSNLAALELEFDSELERRLAGIVESAGAYWDRRSALPWN
jgi:aryl-alcohol dehydrogenase-like predicted oxidoreductase